MPHPQDEAAVQLSQVFIVDPELTTPVFQQLHDSVVHALSTGQLAAGQKLPTVRALAETLQLAPNTVAKAYKSLETAEVIEGKGRSGTFVRFAADPIQAAAQQLAREAAVAFTRIGVDATEAQRLLAEAFATVSRP